MMQFTPTRPLVLALTSAALLLGGCADMSARQKGTATGAAAGAAVGAVLSKVTGGKAGSGAVIGGAVGAVAGNLWSKKMEDKQRAMEQATQGTGIDVSRTADNQLKVNVPSDLSFDSGRSNIRPELAPILTKFSQGLDATMHVQIIGHTDSQGSDAVNNPLSVDRAASVRDYMVSQGVSATRISIEGKGEHQPVADNSTTDGRAKNRRVEIFLREPEKAGS
ncbi:OmpA family protein [uncultured Sphaerotilus sp.]|uniref:OmpA family protein n=1 Tax=uncultured Sphaerotilus sp. TaxID=474984 RepID=UPI0030CA24BB